MITTAYVVVLWIAAIAMILRRDSLVRWLSTREQRRVGKRRDQQKRDADRTRFERAIMHVM